MRVDISFNTEDIHDSETTVPSLNREKTENLTTSENLNYIGENLKTLL